MRRARTDNGLCVIYALYALDKGGRQMRLVDVYRAKRDAMLKGLWEVLQGTDMRNYEGAKLIAQALDGVFTDA